jgi:DNA modification methylase
MIKDIHPETPVSFLQRDFDSEALATTYPVSLVSAVVGMSPTYVKKAVNYKDNRITLKEVLRLLDLDSFSETFIPRSKVPNFLLNWNADNRSAKIELPITEKFIQGSATKLIPELPEKSIQCVVTSTPYWGMRLYNDSFLVEWADGEKCAFGNEQTPEGFIRHTVELLFLLKPAITANGSVWWNLMDTYNTRTQIRENAAETLRAMRGEDSRGWHDYHCRRYSAGHSFLKDGEQSLIPSRVAERASRIGYYIKSIITWKKNGSMPETVETRVTRELEYIIHFSIDRSPLFNKSIYKELDVAKGGRNKMHEGDKLTDVWCFRTSAGRNGHGAQFPIELPGRCIALSSNEGDVILDPFLGGGTTAHAARLLGRRCIGFDVSDSYLNIAKGKARASTAAALPLLDSAL